MHTLASSVQISSHLELHHFADTIKLRQYIVVKLQERLLQLLFTMFQPSVNVIVIPARLLHAKCCKHTADHQSLAVCGINVLPRTPGKDRGEYSSNKFFIASVWQFTTQLVFWKESQTVPVSKATSSSLKEEWTVVDITLCPIILKIPCSRCFRIHPWSSIL